MAFSYWTFPRILFPELIHKQLLCLITRHLMLTPSWLASLSLSSHDALLFSMDITVFTDVIIQLSSRAPAWLLSLPRRLPSFCLSRHDTF